MRINQLPSATEVAQNDVLAIDTSNGTYQVPRSVLAPSPYIATIPTGQWSGSDSDYYITVTASNVTADSILYPFFDSDSEALLTGPVWAVPAAGSFTIHTSAIPSGTVTISVLLAGVVGEAQYQVLADVYSTSQVDSIVAQSTANIGTVYTGTGSVSSVANSAYTEVLSVSVPAGKYIVIRGCDFGANATGVRRVGANNGSGRTDFVTGNAVPGGVDTVIQHIQYVSVSSQTELKCVVLQSSGASLNIWPYMYAVRLA